MLLGSRSIPLTPVLYSTSCAVTSRSMSRLYTVLSMSCGWMPSPTESAPCGSKSTSSTRRPCSAKAAPRLIVVVVLPPPPFWLQTATVRAGPCSISGSGVGKPGNGLPVGPSSPAWGSVIRDAATSAEPPGLWPRLCPRNLRWTLWPWPAAGKQPRRLGPISTCQLALSALVRPVRHDRLAGSGQVEEKTTALQAQPEQAAPDPRIRREAARLQVGHGRHGRYPLILLRPSWRMRLMLSSTPVAAMSFPLLTRK